MSYAPRPLDPLRLLAELDGVGAPGRSAPPEPGAEPGAEAEPVTLRQAAAFALAHNPDLVALRAELGVAKAEILRAGLLPDPEVGWDAMDALAEEITSGTPRTVDFLSGAGISWTLPRPGEIGARVGVARAEREVVRHRILTAEWSLVRRVHLGHLDRVAARARLDLNTRMLAIATRTAEFFRAARELGGATAIQESLAATEVAALRQERVRLENEMRQANQRFNRLLGVPPPVGVRVLEPNDPLAGAQDESALDPRRLVERAMRTRPDLRQLLSAYQAAEQRLRLEVARQWPQVSIGTAFAIVLPVFRGFNRFAIRVALERRELLARRVRAAVHRVRAEVHMAVEALRGARREVRALETTLIPAISETLRLTDQALELREATLVEVLTAQRQVLDVRRRDLEARIRRARARIEMSTVTGAVLARRPPAEEEKSRG